MGEGVGFHSGIPRRGAILNQLLRHEAQGGRRDEGLADTAHAGRHGPVSLCRCGMISRRASLLGGSMNARGLAWRGGRFRVRRFVRGGLRSRLILRLLRRGRSLFVGSIRSRGSTLLGECPRRRTCATREPAQQAQLEHPPPLETQSNHLRIFRAEARRAGPVMRF